MPGKKKEYTLGKTGTVTDLHDLTLPSGATCQAQRPGVQGLIAAGVLNSFDELTALVQTEHIAPNSIAATAKVTKDDEAAAVKDLVAHPEKLGTAFTLVDKLVAFVVVNPVVWVDYILKDESEEVFAHRREVALKKDAVAARDIDLTDKMWLMDWSMGGMSDLKAFREGS